MENVSDALVANLPRTVVQELEIGSKQSGFTRVRLAFFVFFFHLFEKALLSAIDASPYLHHVHVVAPESFEADFLLEARHKLRWKENVARVQRNCVRDAINTWLLMAKRPSLVRMIGKDMRHMIAGYIWRIRFEWPLPIAPVSAWCFIEIFFISSSSSFPGSRVDRFNQRNCRNSERNVANNFCSS